LESVMADRSGQHLTNMMVALLGLMLAATTAWFVVWAFLWVVECASWVVCELREAGRI